MNTQAIPASVQRKRTWLGRGKCALFCLLAFSVPAVSQEKASVESKGIIVEGRVVDAQSGQPVRGAQLDLWAATGKGSSQSVSGLDGAFRFHRVETGWYVLRAGREGYDDAFFRADAKESGRTRLFEVIGEGSAKNLVVRMSRAGVIHGRVFDSNGDPKSGVYVSAQKRVVSDGRTSTYEASGASTDDRGAYRIFRLRSGPYLVRAVPSDYQEQEVLRQSRSRDNNGVERLWTTYYPGTTDAARAVAVDVEAGGEIQIDLALQKSRLYSVRGRVQLPPGAKPAEYTQLWLFTPDHQHEPGRHQIASIDGPNGAFEIAGVLPGSYFVKTILEHEGRHYRASQPVEVVASDVEGIILMPVPGAELRGQINLDPGVRLQMKRLRAGVAAKDTTVNWEGDFADVAENGSFRLSNLPNGEYFAAVLGLGEGLYIREAWLGRASVLKGLRVGDGAGDLLQLKIGRANGVVEGVVLDRLDRPVPGASVALQQDERLREGIIYQRRVTDAAGRFRFDAVPPADFEIVGMEPGYLHIGPDANITEEEYEILKQNTQKFTLKEGGRHVAELRIGKGPAIASGTSPR